MEIIEMYSNLIIRPLEEKIDKLRKKIYTTKFSIFKRKQKQHLEKLENLLSDYYENFAILIEKETIFNEEIKKQINK